MTPIEDVAEAEGEAAGGDVLDAAATNLDLISTTHILDVSMECNDPTSRGISPEKNLTSPGGIVACMFSTSARVIRTPATSISFIKAGMMMVRS